jgi:hypothetical protein
MKLFLTDTNNDALPIVDWLAGGCHKSTNSAVVGTEDRLVEAHRRSARAATRHVSGRKLGVSGVVSVALVRWEGGVDVVEPQPDGVTLACCETQTISRNDAP